ncbi:MAG TPA: alpha/beta hydrolase [Longimicrobium sp.]|nr:alpha/beta hydrolase [Longimicrobium sp.]
MPGSGAGWTDGEAQVGGVRLHWIEAGTGAPVVLLHGFPEFGYAWRHQLPALAAAGFRAVAPDMRGYNLSDKPAGYRSYTVQQLAADVVGLVRALGAERVHLVGHDWGGIVAWHVAMHHPEIVDRLVVINAPHPGVFRREIRKPDQFVRSWYVYFFQLPRMPEWAIRRNDFALLERIFRYDPVRPGAFTDADIRRYKEAAARPGALTAMLSYYRALRIPRPEPVPVRAPTLLIWGMRDQALSERNTHGLEEWVPDLRIERIPDSSHWVMSDVPERTNEMLAGFLRST